ncbi:MAG: tetratricopeptide repeat protein, partial [Gemmatimonadetes bacterium]|nr:tetratricopeptide repeat protein [Gemmatimonadota bacterium]
MGRIWSAWRPGWRPGRSTPATRGPDGRLASSLPAGLSYALAICCFARCLSPASRMNLDKLKESARKYEQSGQWRQAIDVYKKALREFEESGEGVPDPSLYNRIGDLEMKDGDSGSAIRAYEQASDLYTEQGFFNNAIALCSKILRANPGRSATYLR